MPADGVTLRDECRSIAAEWKSQRAERLTRRHLEQRDFDALRDAGLPTEHRAGGRRRVLA